MMEFNIGDRVRSFIYNKEGTVYDKLYSKKFDDYVYTICFDGSNYPDSTPHTEENLECVCTANDYRWEVFMADRNVVTAVLYETIDGVEREVARNHGHVIHSGIIGIAQAASFAMKRIYVGMNDGKLIGLEGN